MSYRKILLLAILVGSLVMPSVVQAEPGDTNCLYPSPTDRFGVTVAGHLEITDYNVGVLRSGRYLNWRADVDPFHPAAMDYYFMVRVGEGGYWPAGEDLAAAVRNNPGSTWIIGNEADVVWQDNTTPEAYARNFHDAYTFIKGIDPTARFVISGIVQASTLRLAWLERVWNSYRANYGVDIPVDIWNIHTYLANEMHLQWGFEVPPGIDNAVGYTVGTGSDWTQVTDAGASGGTVHRSRTPGAKAYFAFHGSQVKIFLRTGPDSGIASIYLDRDETPAAQIDLYSPTPGTVSRTFTGLLPSNGVLQDRHNIRVQVTGDKNPASSNTWIQVDAMEAPSTASLPGGRFEDNDPLRARIEVTVDNHDNLDAITEQIRSFRQWMNSHGQRDKPLINTEYGILMTEDIGFDYPRVRTFMLNSFDRFLNLTDPSVGYPADGNRLLQEWFWFSLAVDKFEGRVVNTGLFSEATQAIKPLGTDFRNYTLPRYVAYTDLEMSPLMVTPYWPLFAGGTSLLRIEANVRNRGNQASGPFDVTFRSGNNALLATEPVAGLPRRFDPGYVRALQYDWNVLMPGPRGVRVIADESDQVVEPCGTNNEGYARVDPPAGTDLALSNLRTSPIILPPTPPGATTTVPLRVDLQNLGSVGTAAAQITVKFYRGNPSAGGTLLGTQTLTPGNVTLPEVVAYDWPNQGPGYYNIWVVVDAVPEESNLANNTIHATIVVPAGNSWLPLIKDHQRDLRPSGPDLSQPATFGIKLPEAAP
ncbi:MAG: CARDB domain-containing protein [Caldilineales bacterium]